MPKRGNTLRKQKSRMASNENKRIAFVKFEKFRLNFSKLAFVTKLL